MAGVLGAASVPFIGCVSMLIAMVLHILAFASPYWAKESNGDFGLWKVTRCEEPRTINGDEVFGCYKWNQVWHVENWLNAVRGLESLTIVFWSIPLVVLPVYIYVALGLKYRCMLATMTVFTFLGAACNIVGVIIFAVKVTDTSELKVGWCLIVCAVAFCPGFIAFVIFLIATFKRPKFTPEHHFVSDFYVDHDRNRMYVVKELDPPQKVHHIQNSGVDNPALSAD